MKDIEVTFHHFENDDEKERMNYVYRLIEKGYKQRFGIIYIHASNEEQAELIDGQLWTFRQESFIPHSMLKNKNDNAPISIGCETLPDMHLDVIINLSDQAEDPTLEPKKFMRLFPLQKIRKAWQELSGKHIKD